MIPWNWKNPFGGQGENGKQSGGPFQSEHVQQYVDQMMKNMFPPQMKDMMNNPQSWTSASSSSQQPATETPFKENVFTTHDDVYVRLTIQDTEWLKSMKLSYTRNQCVVENVPEAEDKWVITLPALVRKKGAKALYKDQILEIKIPKSLDWQVTEIELPEYED